MGLGLNLRMQALLTPTHSFTNLCSPTHTHRPTARPSQVDAMASARILTQQLRADNIVYGMQPVTNIDDVRQEISKFPSSIKSVILINCGASWYVLSRLLHLSLSARTAF